MALTTFDTDVEFIQRLGDQPNDDDGLSADELKYQFDRAAIALKDFINNTMLPELDTAINAAARGITQQGISGEILNDNSITEAKLSKVSGSQAVTTNTLRDQAVTMAKLSSQVQNLLSNLQSAIQTLTRSVDTKASTSSLAAVAISGLYSDLSGVPDGTVVDSEISAGSDNPVSSSAIYTALSQKVDSNVIKNVAYSGSYTDLTDTPTIPVIDSALSTSSTNAVQNRRVTNAINAKQAQHITATGTLNSGLTTWTISVTEVTASNTVFCAPNPASYAQWVDNRVRLSGQNNGTLSFTADTATTASITVNIVILN